MLCEISLSPHETKEQKEYVVDLELGPWSAAFDWSRGYANLHICTRANTVSKRLPSVSLLLQMHLISIKYLIQLDNVVPHKQMKPCYPLI